jgi:hypothetical protein
MVEMRMRPEEMKMKGVSEEEWGGAAAGLPSPPQLPLERVLRLVRMYRAVCCVARLYETCALTLFEREVLPVCTPSSQGSNVRKPCSALLTPLSGTAQLRTLRAHYRVHMVLYVWLSLKGGLELYRPAVGGASLALFGLWETWELQQIFCAASFYNRIRCQLADVCL